MKVVFDMDNTLTDERGRQRRPGVIELLDGLLEDGHTLALWTSSTRIRALRILRDHELRRYFTECRFREDYDPDNHDVGKDITTIEGDVLIDDDERQVRFVRSLGRRGILIARYRGGPDPSPGELDGIRSMLSPSRFRRWRWQRG